MSSKTSAWPCASEKTESNTNCFGPCWPSTSIVDSSMKRTALLQFWFTSYLIVAKAADHVSTPELPIFSL